MGEILSASGTANKAPSVYLQSASGKIQLPVPPESFEVSVQQKNSTVSVNNLGDLNMLGKTGLFTISLSSFFPNQQYSFCQCTPDSPYNYIKTIEGWRTSGKPARITISDTPINYSVTIENFKWGERDGTGDVYFTLDLKEYKFVGGTKDTSVNGVTGLKDRVDISNLAETVKNVTVYPGDSLMDVASRAFGQMSSISDPNKTYLDAYQALAKRGGVSSGNVLTVLNGKTLKVGDSNVHL